jgi:hypothetical protein
MQADLAAVAAVLLALSLTTERLVAIVKTMAPGWFAEPPAGEGTEADPIADRGRRLRVQMVAFASAWITASFLVAPEAAGLAGWITAPVEGIGLPVPLVALLASGGSAFWAQVVGYSSAVKDNAQEVRASRDAAASAAAGQTASPGQLATRIEIARTPDAEPAAR